MLGFKTEIKPSRVQKKQIDRWIGAQNQIYNAKCEEEDYFYGFSKQALSQVGQRPATNAAYSHLVSYWMRAVPSQILRNGACRYYESKQRFLSGLSKHPRKKKGSRRSCRVTNELFEFKQSKDGKQFRVEVKLKRIGKIYFELEKELKTPKMLTLSRNGGVYFLSFSYEDGKKVKSQSEVYKELQKRGYKNVQFLGIDRGIKVQSACSDGQRYEWSEKQKRQILEKEKKKKRYQRKIARQVARSQNRKKTVKKLSKVSAQLSNIRKDFNHQVSKKIVNTEAEVIVFEDLKLKNMTRSASGSVEEPGKNVNAKSGLNRSLLSCNLGQQYEFVKYKAIREGKLVLKVNAHGSSIECRKCAHTDSGNRPTQSEFRCLRCGHEENADLQASQVIAQRGLRDFMSGKVEFLDESRKKIKTTRRRRERACGEDVRQKGVSSDFAASMKQEPESSKSPANAA